jgi:hypothetical protein
MTEAEKLAQRLRDAMCDEGVDGQLHEDAAALIREQEAKIKRMAEALRDAEAYIRGLDSVNGPCLADMKERHADALRDAGEDTK